MAYNENTVLGIVKARLNRLASDTSLDEYLKTRIMAADAELARTGIRLIESDPEDSTLLADFVVWKHNNRDQTGAMPEWLRLARRERWISGKGRRAANVIAVPDFGALTAGETVTLSCVTKDAVIYYTLDGTTPDDSSTEYTDPITVTADIYLRAVAYAQGMEPSIVYAKNYTVA